ncbi:LOB domain-containing protein 36 isoform X1 [Diospyros lotus]|uniref:LOB domain-containing protein 36 isoform X1 n=1 Tax=Diospyros lotus TaxID=55363 RepID=UPI002252F67B|nr:LOB domain-containing protein 36 isoform X1 [Diospyros lotus]XP_052195815.1 LOB domain-containing protein 36 isoform X1 [Diospyros lotus]XP_052195816.1 LOB domain-containing protein 36 isoform X1 [Diospyros lotus]XP_052195817.1 LOB domain-containing protein 36 isoform X1 [Diospyros lotus]XP_052195820.1 LOB domain-containing protein 36 isoform X1 [Diospyros lotus]
MSSSNSPCAACKLQRRKCTQECVFAPYFPPDNPQKFANIHRVFGASNVAKILNELNAAQREDAVNSLAYEADARLRDPVYGCVGLISILQHRLKQVQIDLYNAKKELANYIGPSAMLPIFQNPVFVPPHPANNPSSSSVIPYNMSPMLGLPAGGASHGAQLMIRDPQQQLHHQMLEAQQLAVAREQQEMLRSYEQQQHQQQELVRFNSGFDVAGPVGASGFGQMTGAAAVSPSLALGSFDNPYQIQQQPQDHAHPHHHQMQLQPQLLLQQQQQQQQEPQGPVAQQQRSGSEEGRSAGPSC